MQPSDEPLLPFWSHIEELRVLLLHCFFAILLASFMSFLFSDHIIQLIKNSLPVQQLQSLDIQSLEIEKITNRTSRNAEITLPIHSEVKNAYSATFLPDGRYLLSPNGSIELVRPKVTALFLLSPIEGFTTSLKISLWTGVLLSAPFWVYLIAKFITPGLKNSERSFLFPIVITVLILIALGFFVAIFATLPITNHYFFSFNQALGINSWSLSYYVDYVLTLMLGHGIAFASSSFLFFAIHFRWVSPSQLIPYRRHAIIGILIASALLTPPDILSQLLLAIPLILLFEVVLVYGKFRFRKRGS